MPAAFLLFLGTMDIPVFLRDFFLCLLIGFLVVFGPRALYRMLTDRHHKLHQFPNKGEYDRAVKREGWKSLKRGTPLGVALWVWLCLL